MGRAFRGSTHNEVSQEALGTEKVVAVEVSGVPAGSLGAGMIDLRIIHFVAKTSIESDSVVRYSLQYGVFLCLFFAEVI